MVARTLVTGLEGFTGRYVLPALQAVGHEVIGLGHSGNAGTSTDGYYQVDLLDEAELRRAVNEVRPDHVIHLAAIAAVDHDKVDEIYATNIVGTRNLLAALSGSSTRPQSVIIASSANVYGNAHQGKIAETCPPSPANDYGVSKVATEGVARIFADRLPIIITRPFNYTGVGQTEGFLVPKIVGHARRREPVLRIGNIDVTRDFSDVRMVAQVYTQLLSIPRAIGQTINICSGRGTTLREIIAMVEEIAGFSFDVQVDPKFVRTNEVKQLFGSDALLRDLIGNLAVPSLRETLSWMLDA